MMENRPKVVINRNILLSEKSPPPTKLLISHGKPNFTIVKGTNKIKSPTTTGTEQYSCFKNNLKPSGDLKKKSSFRNDQTNRFENNASTDEEFLRLHKKIGGKNIDEVDFNNSENLEQNVIHIEYGKINSPKDQHFPTTRKSYILTLQHQELPHQEHNNGFENGTNGFSNTLSSSPLPEKPITPVKSTNLRVSEWNQQNRSPSPGLLHNTFFGQSNESVNSTASSTGMNFEPKTIVSFSKDLSVEPNRYPDTVKTTRTIEGGSDSMKRLPREFANLKFEIAGDGGKVIPVKKGAA